MLEGQNEPVATPGGNVPEYSVSEVSQQVKRTVESAFGRVRVRGEISRPNRAASGHIYLTLKDESAVLDGVVWRGAAQKLSIRPEDGMEVIATGRLTTYPGRSKYQMVIESMELAGEGALLKLLEDRRKRLTAEGLFDAERKRPLPFLPSVIGVVTSPTGAVIRDILHRLADRFPRHVLVWPVLVQGDGAKDQIAAAIEGFGRLMPDGPLPRPDVLIVARGGGSLEDLWAFNEEEVVRAAAASPIPLISAVGHETDTTLIDFASDRRAPTPTAAAEMAVPVRDDLLAQVMDDGLRLFNGMRRLLEHRDTTLRGLARGLPEPERLIETKAQTLDYRGESLDRAADRMLDLADRRVEVASQRLPDPRKALADLAQRLDLAGSRIDREAARRPEEARRALDAVTRSLRPDGLHRRLGEGARAMEAMSARLERSATDRLARAGERLAGLDRLLEASSFTRTLDRGFVLVTDQEGRTITRAADAQEGAAVSLRFADGTKQATLGQLKESPEGGKPPQSAPKRKRAATGAETAQEDLFG